jgi:hypothetical protein
MGLWKDSESERGEEMARRIEVAENPRTREETLSADIPSPRAPAVAMRRA